MNVKCCSAHLCNSSCDHKEEHEPDRDQQCDKVKVACKYPAICIPTDKPSTGG